MDEQYFINNIRQGFEQLNRYSMENGVDPFPSGLRDFSTSINGLDGIGPKTKNKQKIVYTKNKQEIVYNIQAKLGHLNALFLPPGTDKYIQRIADNLRELSKTR